MKNLILALLLAPSLLFAQSEEECKSAGDYWSDDLAQCFAVSAMDEDEILLLRNVRVWEAEKHRLNHEDKEFSAPDKNAAVASFNTRINSLTAKRDAALDADVIATYQAEIDRLVAARDEYAGTDVNHGSKISELSQKIGKHKEELDKLLVQ